MAIKVLGSKKGVGQRVRTKSSQGKYAFNPQGME